MFIVCLSYVYPMFIVCLSYVYRVQNYGNKIITYV